MLPGTQKKIASWNRSKNHHLKQQLKRPQGTQKISFLEHTEILPPEKQRQKLPEKHNKIASQNTKKKYFLEHTDKLPPGMYSKKIEIQPMDVLFEV